MNITVNILSLSGMWSLFIHAICEIRYIYRWATALFIGRKSEGGEYEWRKIALEREGDHEMKTMEMAFDTVVQYVL